MKHRRKSGEETPYIKLGIFSIRLPFWHYRFEWPDFAQGLLMCAVDLAAIPLMIELLGMPFEAALAVVMLNGLLYLTHHILGDPVIPGWITPAIPLVIAYCSQYEEGPERVQSLVAFQFLLGVFCIGLGMTGQVGRVVGLIPSSIKSGIILGSGLAAVMSVFQKGGRFDMFPWSISICVGLAFYLVFSTHFQSLKARRRGLAMLGKLGIVPVMLLALLLAPLVGEVSWPTIEWGFSRPDFKTLWTEYTVFGVGIPPLEVFVKALPTAVAAYIILFGDVLQSKAIVAEADVIRSDEKIDYNPGRSHLIFGGRNALMSVIGPDVTMCGPMWAAMQVVVVERFKDGGKAMYSLFGGSGCFRWGTNFGLLLLPVVSLLKPVLGIALALTLLIQGYISFRIGVMEARSQKDLGIAGVVGAVLATKGAAWGFAVGIVLCLLIYGRRFFSGDEGSASTDVDSGSSEDD
ncbi:hypothetical protein MLD52_10295 [Puniceicoccaceae bacterium K14]|nr:hypothetical protein [Puniceicoccaceae bacterium K14]